MADIRNDQYLHRPGAGRGAITPADPLETILYGPNGQPIGAANRLPVEATLTGSLPILDTVHQNAVSANGNGTVATVQGYGALRFQVTGTFSATVNFEGTIDGTNWRPLPVLNESGQMVTTANAAGIYRADIAGLHQVRARISGYASGSVTVRSRALPLALPVLQSVQATLTGSMVEVVKEWLNNTDLVGQTTVRYFATNVGPGLGNPPIDMRPYVRRAVYIRNGHNESVDVRIFGYRSLQAGTGNVPERIIEIVSLETLAAGAAKLYYDGEYPMFKVPVPGIAAQLSPVSESATGSVDVVYLGARV